jgi:hypothetical protein
MGGVTMTKLLRSTAARLFLVAPFVVGILLAASPAKAVKVTVKDDTFIDLRLLLQPWVSMTYQDWNVKPEQPDLDTQFYLRRMRIILGGQITKWVSFFAETDNPNFGQVKFDGASQWTTMYMQDAYVSFDLHPSLHIIGGLLLLPFTHHSYQSAASLHTLDYHTALIKYPDGSTQTWRSTGVMLRGILFQKWLEYRFAVTTGTPQNYGMDMTKNNPGADTDGIPRFTGRLAFNLFDAEDSFFAGGTYLGAKKILTIGLAMDGQPGAYAKDANAAGVFTGDRYGYFGLGGDVFWDIPIGANRVSGQLAFLYYAGDKHTSGNTLSKGYGLMFDAGYAIGKWEPVIIFDWYRYSALADLADKLGESAVKANHVGIFGGLNYWWMGHSANIKLQMGYEKTPGASVTTTTAATSSTPAATVTTIPKGIWGDGAFKAILQTQLLF